MFSGQDNRLFYDTVFTNLYLSSYPKSKKDLFYLQILLGQISRYLQFSKCCSNKYQRWRPLFWYTEWPYGMFIFRYYAIYISSLRSFVNFLTIKHVISYERLNLKLKFNQLVYICKLEICTVYNVYVFFSSFGCIR